MSDDQQEPGNLTARPRQSRIAVARAKAERRELVRRRSPPPPALAPSTAPVEPAPVPWTGVLPSAQILLDTRRARRRRFFLRLGLFSGLPTLLTLLYMLFVASPRYVSQFEVTYQSYQPAQNLTQGLVQSVLGTSQSNNVDFSALLYEYIRSQSLLKNLDEKLHLRQYYSARNVDYFSRMNPKASLDTFLRYYQWYVSVSEENGGYLTVDVQAFDPDYAQALAKAIVEACDKMVDEITLRPLQDEVRFAEGEVARAERRVRRARQAMTDFQNAHGDINPPTSASQLNGIVGGLEGQLAAARTELNMLVSTAPHSPQIAATRAQIAALEGQLKQEQNRLANSAGGAPYSVLLDEYNAIQLEQQFARSDYMAAQQGLEVARANAARQENYLVAFIPPNRPDKEDLEFALIYTFTAFVTSLVLFAIGSLIGGAMRDQAGL
jgi:capsular polysaccharide transport system permease protein